MAVNPLPLSQNNAPLMALADAALSNDESEGSPSKDSQEPMKAKVSTTTPMDRLTFAQQIMKLLDEDTSPYLKWMPDGKSFTIKNCKKFTADEMPRLFHIRNMSSFVRKLTRWGFSRHHEKETMNFDIFKHTHFERGNWERCAQIKCAAPSQSPVSVTAIRKVVRKTSPERPGVKPLPAKSRPISPVISTAAKTKPTTCPAQQQPQADHHHWKPLVHPSLRNHPAPASHSLVNDAAVLKSMVEQRDWLKLDHAVTTRANLLTLQLLKEASQQQLHYDHALIQYWLARQQLPNHHQQLAAAAAFRN